MDLEEEAAAQVPPLDVELEDGEICDDDAEESTAAAARLGEGNGGRPDGVAAPPRAPRTPGFRPMMPYDLRAAPSHRRPSGPLPLPLPPGPGPGPGFVPLGAGPGPRPSFWERSHGALGRFRHRGVHHGGRGAWNREGWAGHRPPAARFGPTENNNGRAESPARKQKLLGRNPARRAPPSLAKGDGAESFEDLLSKYKQIQLELECIRKEESMALGAKVRGREAAPQGAVVKDPGSGTRAQGPEGRPAEAPACLPAEDRKGFRAFNIKPLRVKLCAPAGLDAGAEEEPDAGREGAEAQKATEACAPCRPEAKEDRQTPGRESSTSSEDVFICLDELGGQVEEEDLSELQLRLLALQSASRKWQQKERQVMKRSREATAADGRTGPRSKTRDRERDKAPGPGGRERPKPAAARAAPDRSRPKKSGGSGDKAENAAAGRAERPRFFSPAPKQALRRQRLRACKLERQRDQDERHKREDEIRKIRDLSNQDEQYKRFMKLVGGKMHGCGKARDGDARKSSGRAGPDAAGNLYQYDNYDEVAMDTDSETGSPARPLFPTEGSPAFPGTPSAACAPPLPPLADDPAPPPEPPFADEEEEEEMLLRETCLMSMANKRVVTAEEPFWSGPPSPSAAPPAGSEQPGRGNLSAVSLNTMTAPRGNKFTRGGGASRAPLVLPRHKSVVVSLNGSDDSDSDPEAAAQGMFGGLEFMIKEARRTAEVNASKPKGVPGASEKENDPLRTPEALPEAKKAEYRLLREELASREKHKASANRGARSTPAANPVAPSPVSEAEQKLLKQRELLLRDEALLKNLLQQQLKKSESLKAAESKVARLREQMQASEKIVLANKTLLKKIQEQVRRVEHRVSVKKMLAARLEQELLWLQKAAGREAKRKGGALTHKPTRKLPRLDPANHFAALMAQKQRLQRLESEYALKIQKLKEAQASRNKAAPSEAAGERKHQAAAPPDPKATLPSPPQPSLHDLTQDILVLDSEDGPDAEPDDPKTEEPQALGAPRPRCRSSSTKPNLDQLSGGPAAAKSVADSSLEAPVAPEAAAAPEAEAAAALEAGAPGLDLEALRSRRRPGPGQLLEEELLSLGELHRVEERPHQNAMVATVGTGASKGVTWSGRPVPFGPYRSPLLVFKSYRFSPYYRTKEKLSLSSATYSNAIQPKRRFCRFDLTGTCNDDDCSWQHVRSCALTGSRLFQDVLSYNLSLIGCSDSSSDSQVGAATEKYLSKLLGPHKDGMAADQKAVFLVSKVNESRRHVPPFTTWKDKRKWRPPAQSRLADDDHDVDDDDGGKQTECQTLDADAGRLEAAVTSEDKRYFVSDADDICKLESGVSEQPGDTQLWIKLAFRYLRQGCTPPGERLEAALNTLSRALENNCEDPEVWTHYLTLFSRRGRRDEVEEMCQMAVEHAPHGRVWWTYLNLASTFEVKDSVCERLVNFLLGEARGAASEELSFQLLEALLYRVHLNVFTGRADAAMAIFQDALRRAQPHAGLGAAHRALAWLAYIHLKEFGRLPAALYDPSESGPSRLLGARPFLLPWRSAADVTTPPEQLVCLFTDAIRQCADPQLAPSERTSACLPLHSNFLLLHKLLDRRREGAAMCQGLLDACPDSRVLLEALCELRLHSGDREGAAGAWLAALALRPHDAELLYHAVRFFMTQDEPGAVAPLFRSLVSSVCEEPCAHVTPVHLLRSLLGPAARDLRSSPPVREDLRGGLLRQRSFLHLLHCRWHWLHSSPGDALDAFERALGSAGAGCLQLHRLWTDYLQFCSARAAHRLPDLVLRCLGTVPARLEVPFDPTRFWTSYRFHNEVVALYLGCVEPSRRTELLERLHDMMPANIALSLRLMQQEWREGNMEHVRFLARMLTNSAPKCLPAWNIAIAVEAELGRPAEVRRLVQQALQNLPLCAHLWKQLLQWEARVGGAGAAERAGRALSRGREAGVTLAEPAGALAVTCRALAPKLEPT